MTQPLLFTPKHDCWTEKEPTGDPYIVAHGAVNRFLTCRLCGKLVGEESWTREAWDAIQAKGKATT